MVYRVLGIIYISPLFSQDVGVDDSKLWRSSPIMSRLSATTLTTKSGTLYHLIGNMDINEMKQNMSTNSLPVNDILASKFINGFPQDWNEIVLESKDLEMWVYYIMK